MTSLELQADKGLRVTAEPGAALDRFPQARPKYLKMLSVAMRATACSSMERRSSIAKQLSSFPPFKGLQPPRTVASWSSSSSVHAAGSVHAPTACHLRTASSINFPGTCLKRSTMRKVRTITCCSYELTRERIVRQLRNSRREVTSLQRISPLSRFWAGHPPLGAAATDWAI
jgi:hypothetical protein